MKEEMKVSGEEVEVVAWLSTDCIGERYLCFSKPLDNDPVEELMTVAQHQRITEALLEDARYNYQLALDWQDKVIELQAERDQLRAEVERLKAANESLRLVRDEYKRMADEYRAKWAAQLAQQQVPGWKLVPVEPTPEMVSAAEEAHMPFGDMDIALLMAILSAPSAPAPVQGVNAQLLEALVEITTYPESGQEHELRRIARAAIAAARKGEGE